MILAWVRRFRLQLRLQANMQIRFLHKWNEFKAGDSADVDSDVARRLLLAGIAEQDSVMPEPERHNVITR